MASVAFSLTTGSSDTNNTAIGAPIENSNVLKKIAPWHTSDSSFRFQSRTYYFSSLTLLIILPLIATVAQAIMAIG